LSAKHPKNGSQMDRGARHGTQGSRRPAPLSQRRASIIWYIAFVVYLLVGLYVAGRQGWLQDLGYLSNLLEAIIVVLLWPAILVGSYH
jgi:hypothetical protein